MSPIAKKKIVYLSFGSNKGDRKENIRQALNRLNAMRGVRLLSVSSLYKTAPVGGPPQPFYLNGVAKLAVSLTPIQMLSTLKTIEGDLGRKKAKRWGPRVIDLDILTYGHHIIRTKNLSVPHVRYHQRRFVLVPFKELAPHFRHPVIRKTNSTLLDELTPDGQKVTIHSRWKKLPFLFS